MNKLKIIIAGTIIVGIMAGGVVIEGKYNKDIKIKDKIYSGAEYRALRKEIAQKASEDNLDVNSFQIYIEMLNKEMKACKSDAYNKKCEKCKEKNKDNLEVCKNKCKYKMYPYNSKQDIRDLLLKFDKFGCPK